MQSAGTPNCPIKETWWYQQWAYGTSVRVGYSPFLWLLFASHFLHTVLAFHSPFINLQVANSLKNNTFFLLGLFQSHLIILIVMTNRSLALKHYIRNRSFSTSSNELIFCHSNLSFSWDLILICQILPVMLATPKLNHMKNFYKTFMTQSFTIASSVSTRLQLLSCEP